MRLLRIGPGQFALYLLYQTAVAGQAEQEVDAVRLAPGHQGLAREAAVGAQQDAGSWLACPDLGTMRSTSSTVPALASMFERRSLAASR